MIDECLLNLFKLISLSLNGTDEHPDLTGWQYIQRELEAQSVLPVVSDYVFKSGIPENDKYAVMKKTAVNIRKFHKIMTVQNAVIELLDANGIKAVILKGASASQYYPKPSLRQLGDIDILVPPDDYDKAFNILTENGYKNQNNLDSLYRRHIGFTAPDGTKIELHRFFSSSKNKEQNSFLDATIFNSMSNIKHICVEGYNVPVLPELENGLVLLGHINQHLSTGLGLR